MMDISALRERENTGRFTVSGLNAYIKTLFENNRTLTSVTVEGEISNFTYHRSGHLYFSLKDSEGQIRSVMFRSYAARLKFMPESGMRVIVHGSVTVYPRDGSYQLYVSSMQPDGVGALYLAYEQIKERLSAEGLFSPDHKLPIPKYPRKIGVITSPTGAAVRDIINVTSRRFALADIYLYPALVQGEGAEADLISAVDYFDKSRLVDVVIIGRGGGSIEDLWAFNSEKLARRIYEASVPFISAVGHETDFTICDFVCDMRAPTPSAAAELAVPDVRELLVRTDGLSDRAIAAFSRLAERSRLRLLRAYDILRRRGVEAMLQDCRERTDRLVLAAESAIASSFEKRRGRLALCAEKMNVMNPLSVLSRGYSITTSANGMAGNIDSLNIGDTVDIRFIDGVARATVTETKKQEAR